MGVGEDTDIDAGILGIGFPANVASEYLYPNIIDELVSHGYINSRAYSLYLNDQESNTGSILFGGIDTEKFEGELVGLPIQLPKGQTAPRDFWVALNSVGFISIHGDEEPISENINLGVILDSGSSLTYLPNSTVTKIVTKFGGIWSEELEAYSVPCDLSNSHDEFVTYQFGGNNGPKIRVSAEELTNYLIDINGDLWTNEDGNPECIFGLQPQPDDHGDIYIFGDTFLRSAYVVHDLDGSKIWMAQTIFNATKSNILEIEKSNMTRSGVPNASGVESDVSITPTATETERPRFGTGLVTPSGTSETSETSQSSETSRAESTGTQTTDAASTSATTTSQPNAGLKVAVDGLMSLGTLILVGAVGALI
ncbi:Candidapepsin-4 [Dactylella cylindrospora]|nr:Candidapepsin-4 [Dactylella cylindrospora]